MFPGNIIHVNPDFMKSPKVATTIHMNPEFLNKNLVAQSQRNVQIKEYDEASECKNIIPDTVPKVTQLNKIITKSRTRIVRESHHPPVAPPIGPSVVTKAARQLLLLTKRKLVRVANIPSRIKTYKIDRKNYELRRPLVKRRQRAFVARYALRRSNSIGVGASSTKKPNDTSITSSNRSLRLVNINGILYKSTGNKLQRKVENEPRPTNNVNFSKSFSKLNSSSQKPQQTNKAIIKNLKTSKINIGRTLYVRGAKYVMDPKGFRLTRITDGGGGGSPTTRPTSTMLQKTSKSSAQLSNRGQPRRIDIGGLTYLASNQSNNVLVRTSTHLALAHLNHAKQRSVHVLLSRSLTKTNKPCQIFQRLGKCAALERNRCSKVHNKLNVVVCPKFLQGQCVKSDCLLSHNKTFQKMPVCKFFLQGCCVRTDCPYLHKKLSDGSEICEDFRRGFCPLAEQCNKQHIFSSTTTTRKTNALRRPLECKEGDNSGDDMKISRYFDGEKFVIARILKDESEAIESSSESEERNSEESENEDDVHDDGGEKQSLRRKLLGALPAFIPLS